MMDMLAGGAPLRACREAMASAHCLWKVASGAHIFVHPWQYAMVEAATGSMSLKSSHVVVAASLEHLVAESLASAPGGAWAKTRVPLVDSEMTLSAIEPSIAAELGDELTSAATSGDIEWTSAALFSSLGFEVRGTFLCD